MLVDGVCDTEYGIVFGLGICDTNGTCFVLATQPKLSSTNAPVFLDWSLRMPLRLKKVNLEK